MAYRILKQTVAAIALMGAFGAASALTAYAVPEGNGGNGNAYTFSDGSGTKMADLTVNYLGDKKSLNFSFSELSTYLGDVTSFTIYYSNNGQQSVSDSYSFLKDVVNTISVQKLGGNGAIFTKASVGYVSAVPEPESYAMLLAGLGLVGTIAVRRRKSLGSR